MHSEWIWINNEIKSPTDGYIIYVPAIPQRDSWMMKLKPNSLIKYETPQFLFHFLNTFSFFLRIVRAFPTEELLLILHDTRACKCLTPWAVWLVVGHESSWRGLHGGVPGRGCYISTLIYLFIYYMSFVYSSCECYLFGITFFLRFFVLFIGVIIVLGYWERDEKDAMWINKVLFWNIENKQTNKQIGKRKSNKQTQTKATAPPEPKENFAKTKGRLKEYRGAISVFNFPSFASLSSPHFEQRGPEID